MICPDCAVQFKGGRFWTGPGSTAWRKCPNGHKFIEPKRTKGQSRDQKLIALLRSRIEESDRIILTLTEDHNSTPNYVRGFDMAQAYFAKYHDEEAGK